VICHEAKVVAVFIFGCLRHRDIRMALLSNVARMGNDQPDVRLSGSETDVAAVAQPVVLAKRPLRRHCYAEVMN
jgi:hypothetical protein